MRKLRNQVAYILWLLAVLPALADQSTGDLVVRRPVSNELHAVSQQVQELQKKLADKFGIGKVYIGGGAVRAILDHIYFGKPIDMRDFDIAVVANRHVTPEFADKMARQLQSPLLGRYDPADLHANVYTNPALPLPERNHYNVGQNFFLRWPQGGYLDIAVFHTDSDLKLNGLFDTDTILLPLTSGKTLEDFVTHEMKTTAYEDLARQGKIIDRHAGYHSWLNHQTQIVNWSDVEADPVLRAIRVLRAFNKGGAARIPEPDRTRLKKLIAGDSGQYGPAITGNLLKVVNDPRAAEELKELEALGVLQHWSPAFAERIRSLTVTELDRTLDSAAPIHEGYAPPKAVGRIYALIDSLPPRDKRLLLAQLKDVEPRANLPCPWPQLIDGE